MIRHKLAFGAALATLATPAVASGLTDLSSIDSAVAQFTGASIGAPGGARSPVDRRLRLGQCGSAMALEWYGRGQGTVLVRCPEPGGWRVFVPLNTGGQQATRGAEAVTRGSRVMISFRGSGFTLSRQGEALESGAVGDWIRVKPADRQGDPMRAQVLRPGVVGMELP